MKQKLISFFENKRVRILGFGKEGRASCEFLCRNVPSARITVADQKPCALPPTCNGIFGDDYLRGMEEEDILLKAPGVVLPFDLPNTIRQKITSETDLFLRFRNGRTIGVTGTKGKSTTSSLIHHILTFCGGNSRFVGNIGIPVFSCLDELTETCIAVYEMSCHQLEYVQASPDIGVLLNVYEDHLDHYASFDAYREAKYNIFRFMRPQDVLIAGLGCENLDYDRLQAQTMRKIFIDPERSPEIPSHLLGRHNRYNIEVAMTAAALCGCDWHDMIDAVSCFHGLPHRLEYVATKSGVTYYNDSISTIPEATQRAVEAVGNVQTVLIGGMDRGIDYGGLTDFLASGRVPNVILMYESGKRISDLLQQRNSKASIYYEKDLSSAVSLAKRITLSGSVLLSPAAASYGDFKNFEERGERFCEEVKEG